MSPIRILTLAGAALAGVALLVLPQYLVARQTAESPVVPLSSQAQIDRPAIEEIVRSYLLENPQLLREMMTRLQEKERTDQVAGRASVFDEYGDTIYNSPRQVVLGNPQGDVTLVEFFDYNCGYCRKALPDIEALLKNDSKLKVVLKEFPVLGEGSRDAARVAVAVHTQAPDKYLEFHREMLGTEQPADGARAIEVARSLGLDIDRLSADLTGPNIDDPLIEAHQLAEKLGIDGTPTFVVANTVVPGAIGLDALQELVANVRSCGKVACS